jgi:PAS domain S-box-containing protein
VEDNPGDARLMQEYLADSSEVVFTLEHVVTLAAGLERLTRPGIDVVLLDLTLPDCAGLETFTRVQKQAPQMPIIVLSGQDDEALATKTVHSGAQDYLVKGQGVDSRLISRSIRYAIERKRTEEALAKERDLLHTLLNNLPDRIYFKDDKSRFMRISRAVAQQFKLSDPRDAIGKTDFDFFAREHAEAALKDEQEVMSTGKPIIGKIEKETLPDGTVTWAFTTKLPLKDKHGRIVGNFGISRDITQLKKFEDDLAAERNLLRSLIDNLPDYIYVKDLQGHFILDNIAHRRFVGVKREEDVIGRTVADYFPAELAKRLAEDDRTILESGVPLLNREELVVDRAGKKRWHSTTKVPLCNHDGKTIGLVGISRDITSRKEGEEQLQRANTELAKKQEQLQTALNDLRQSHEDLKAAQFQLIQAEKMQSVGRLAAGVAHEVKNPLAVLTMGADYLMKNLPNPEPETKIILADMTEAVKRADTIIRGLLDFSATRALDLNAESLSTVLEQSLGLVRHEFGGAVKLVKKLAPDLPLIQLDHNKIKQVFVNVLTNALQAMPDGGTLTVRTYAKQLEASDIGADQEQRFGDKFRAGQTVVIADVMDTGIGIPQDKLPKIFDPFFTTKPAGKGTGLGLTVARKIVELHGGELDICNRPEGGVRATLTFKT